MPAAPGFASLARPPAESFSRQDAHWLGSGAGPRLPHLGRRPGATRSAANGARMETGARRRRRTRMSAALLATAGGEIERLSDQAST